MPLLLNKHADRPNREKHKQRKNTAVAAGSVARPRNEAKSGENHGRGWAGSSGFVYSLYESTGPDSATGGASRTQQRCVPPYLAVTTELPASGWIEFIPSLAEFSGAGSAFQVFEINL